MNLRVLITILPYFAFVAIAALVGFSITQVDVVAAEHQVGFTAGGALLAGIAIAISRIFTRNSTRPFPSIPERKLLGLKVGTVGFCIAMLGWLVAVLANHTAGFSIVVFGVVTGFVGMAIHFLRMFSSNE